MRAVYIHVRAVHLEIVDDRTAKEFLLAFRRFIAKRGNPSEIISDNTAQFKLSKPTIDVAWQKVIKDPSMQSYISNQGIKWHLSLNYHHGLVGSSKIALRKSIGKNYLTSLLLHPFYQKPKLF